MGRRRATRLEAHDGDHPDWSLVSPPFFFKGAEIVMSSSA